MKGPVSILTVMLLCAAGCSNSTSEANSGKGGPDVPQGSSLENICSHLTSLAPEGRKAQFTQTACTKEYQTLLSTCSNAPAVSECLLGIKSWSERMTCIDACALSPGAGKR